MLNVSAGRTVYRCAGPRAPCASVRCCPWGRYKPCREEGAVEPIRERIEDFLRRWRSRYDGDRVIRVLVITVVLAAYAVTSSGLQQAPTYEASAQVWVAWAQRTLEYRGEPPTQEIIHTIGTRSVAQEATQRLGLQMDP